MLVYFVLQLDSCNYSMYNDIQDFLLHFKHLEGSPLTSTNCPLHVSNELITCFGATEEDTTSTTTGHAIRGGNTTE